MLGTKRSPNSNFFSKLKTFTMRLKLLFLEVLFAFTFQAFAQSNTLIVNPTIYLPKDSIETKVLISAINKFLFAADKPNEENQMLLEEQKLETFILLDEFKGITKSEKYQDDYFYKPYLTNIVALNANEYRVQVSYIGIQDQNPLLRASFEFIAYRINDVFLFSSPLIENTKHWSTEKRKNYTFHYQGNINKENVNSFESLANTFDKKLKSSNKQTEFYCLDNLLDLQKLTGVNYKMDYNGRTESVWSTQRNNKSIILLGNRNANFDIMDPHDLWHDRLSLVIPRGKVSKSVDEGIAYIYAGSWGLTWKEIFKEFIIQVASDKSTNWMDAKEERINFKTNGFNNSADYIVNALIVQKIETEKGFDEVWQLLNVGPFEIGNEKYYAMLEKLTGITKENYNEAVWKLIEKEKSSLTIN